MAHSNEVTVDDVYNCTGRPSPEEIETIFNSLLNDTMTGSTSTITTLKVERSLTLDDIVRELHTTVMKSGLPQIHKMYVVIRLSDIEQRIAIGCNEKVQIASLVGAFVEIRSMRK